MIEEGQKSNPENIPRPSNKNPQNSLDQKLIPPPPPPNNLRAKREAPVENLEFKSNN